VDHERAQHALESLFTESPNEFLAMRAKSGLLEEAQNELMLLHFEHVLLLQSSFSTSNITLDLHLTPGSI
jgi:hypothetical protein